MSPEPSTLHSARLPQAIAVGLALLFSALLHPSAALAAPPAASNRQITTGSTGSAQPVVLATIDVGLNPRGVAFTPDWHHAYVANAGSNTVSVIDVRRRTVIATIPVGLFPYGVAFTPSGRIAYIANRDSDTVSVIDTARRQVITTTAVGDAPRWVALHTGNRIAYVANSGSDSVFTFDTRTNTVLGEVAVGDDPRWTASGPAGTFLCPASWLGRDL